ncbi:cysteine desulfurase family protein [Sulfurimonas sp.]|uniref:cysteine desulfurase family protein n=1 Tax=Sulfurimonas sp. TaxID=2022749 RepID=UPI00286E48AF|nr:cysteine desulfurase family protein [Sulfurimonas sp.]
MTNDTKKVDMPIYLDYNATTPVDSNVADIMDLYLRRYFGNPSSGHIYGVHAHEAVELARSNLASLIRAQSDEIIFTSCATEANNLAICGSARAMRHIGRHIITSAVEHPSVVQPFLRLRDEGWDVTILPVDKFGRIDSAELSSAIRDDTVLVSIMHSNNEVGTIQPIEEISEITRRHGILLHTDASQSIGKVEVSVESLGVDLLTIAGHKFYASKGVGALYVRRGVLMEPVLVGAGHENGIRPGTENVPGIAGIGEAARIASKLVKKESLQLRQLRDELYSKLLEAIPGLALNGHPKYRLPNTLSLSFPQIKGKELLDYTKESIAASVGSACHEEDGAISGVLGAMGLSKKEALGTVRLSIGRFTTKEEIAHAAEAIIAAWRELSKTQILC